MLIYSIQNQTTLRFLATFCLQAGSLLAVGDADGGVRLVGGRMIKNL